MITKATCKDINEILNEEMAKYADACILFPGGKGTQHMKDIATASGMRVITYPA